MQDETTWLLTGATGFLGRHILKEFDSKGIKTLSLGRSPANEISCNLADTSPDLDGHDIDHVIHAAGLAHTVPKSQEEQDRFFRVNLEGTKHLMASLDLKKLKTFIFISSVAVYGREEGSEIKEDHPLLGTTPYAKSKIESEDYLLEQSAKFDFSLVILRLPLLAGLNPPGNLRKIQNAIDRGFYFRIGKGEARKSMVACTDIAKIITTLSGKSGIYNLTDGNHPALRQIDVTIASLRGKKIRSLPQGLLYPLAKIGNLIPGFPFNEDKFDKLNSTLTFCDTRAREILHWNPSNAIESLG